MTQQTLFYVILLFVFIYAILQMYIWHAKVIPFWEMNKQNFDLKFWSLDSKREMMVREFLKSFSNDADKPWFYYFVKFWYLAGVILIPAAFLSFL
jgi:hypothetical protein